jgi:hypothetical protein
MTAQERHSAKRQSPQLSTEFRTFIVMLRVVMLTFKWWERINKGEHRERKREIGNEEQKDSLKDVEMDRQKGRHKVR